MCSVPLVLVTKSKIPAEFYFSKSPKILNFGDGNALNCVSHLRDVTNTSAALIADSVI